ncbi:4Fe-4S dicluster domain-containing protein [candidate division WOR-3 bacterium]|nr:4Fe-4S dicluster domain-containing protein [candidate division WOR-3 bacterium]
MDWGPILTAVGVLSGVGLFIAVLLLIASILLTVKVDEREAAVRAALPGANCGACGFPGCDGLAAAIAQDKAPLNACTVGGQAVAAAIGAIIGQEAAAAEPQVAALICRGGRAEAAQRFQYKGAQDCRQAALLLGGPKACIYGCVGLGHCVSVCPFSAISIGDSGLPVIDEKKCTGCGRCVRECPKSVLRLIPRAKLVYLACASHDKGRAVKDVCRVGCIGCGLCAKSCPTGALKMEANLPVMDFGRCIDCGICVHKCPTKSFRDRAPGRPMASISPRCNGCAECVKVCQFKAIQGEPGQQHKVLTDRCIGCGQCVLVCQPRAIDMIGALGHSVRAA